MLFLSFAFSIGNLLIVGLREQVDLGAINNEWVKKIGVTPVMVIVAVLISILAGFTPLANLIMPNKKFNFMVADVGVTCQGTDLNSATHASSLMAVISSDDQAYIRTVDNFLRETPDNYIDKFKLFLTKTLRSNYHKRFDVDFVEKKQSDVRYRLLKSFAKSGEFGSDGLKMDLANDLEWIAYTVKLEDPDHTTPIQIPTVYEKNHRTRLFLFRPPVDVKDPAVDLLNRALNATATPSPDPNISAVVRVKIVPHVPDGPSGTTEVGLETFYDGRHICWTNRTT